jgi:hypothetical protein
MLHAKWINQNLAYWDTHQCRIIDAWGPTVCKFIDDFVNAKLIAADAPLGWTVTLVEAGGGESTITAVDAVGGQILLRTDANEDDGITMQVLGENFLLASLKPCYFGIKLKVSEATQSDLLAGLCVTGATPLTDAVNGVYFQKVDGATALTFNVEKASAATGATVLATVVAGTWYTLEFYFDGVNVDSYVNGVKQTRLAMTNLPTAEELTPTIEWLNGVAVSNPTLTIDWVRAIQFN